MGLRARPKLIRGAPITSFMENGLNGSISGAIFSFTSNTQTAGSSLLLSSLDRLIVFSFALSAAGAGVYIKNATINGVPAYVEQVEVAGHIAAVVYVAIMELPDDRTFRLRGELSASGATNARGVVLGLVGLSSNSPVSVQKATDVANTVLTVTMTPPVGREVAVCINDVTAANSVTWSGTAGVTEQEDQAVGNCRYSYARRVSGSIDLGSADITATYAVSSVLGIALLAVSWR